MEQFPTLPDCACEMAEVIFAMIDRVTGIVEKEKKSENIDGYAVTYVTGTVDGEMSEKLLRKKLYDVICLYMADTGVLYCGID